MWSMNAPLGKNSIGKILKMAAKRKGLQGNSCDKPRCEKDLDRQSSRCRCPCQLCGSAQRPYESQKFGFVQICIFTSPAQHVTRTEPLRTHATYHQHHCKQRVCNIYSIYMYNQIQCFSLSYRYSRCSIS